jgi:hypothetical protein
LKYQVDKIEVFRCKKGYLKGDNLKIPFDFGIVFESEGILTFEISISKTFDSIKFREDENDKYFDTSFTAFCNSDRNDKIEIRKLHFSTISVGTLQGKLTCYDRIIHTKKKESPFEKGIKSKKNPKLHYLELEGLKMQFIDITEEIRNRHGIKSRDLNHHNRDHTLAQLVYKNSSYSQLFYKSEKNQNIIVEFPDNGSRKNLSYKTYLQFKLNYVYSLSLLNGAQVRIRKEYTGDFYSGNKVDAHITILYSFKQISNERYDHYIPLNDLFSRSDNIINSFFTRNFNNYINWDKKIDLDSIVFYFINSVQAKSMEEIAFIQMIAFERLTTLYAEYKGEKEIFMPSKKEYENIKTDFLEILEKHKSKFGDTYNIAKSKLCNLNQVKRLSTTDKMYRLINDVNIEITEEIRLLVEQMRHKTIHRGELEKGEKKVANFYLLDELIQEIILRLVGYNGSRHSRIHN